MEKKQNGMTMRLKNYKLFILLCLFISCSSNELSYYDRRRFGSSFYRKNNTNNTVKEYDNDYYDNKNNDYKGYNKNEIIEDNSYNRNNNKVSMSNDYNSCGGGYYKIGNPYKIGNKKYYPKKYKKYVEYGLASWYGDDFHRNRTANDDIFNMNAMTGAHNTLPLPSIVRVTNLENGKSLKIRINDRGPFVEGRVVDVSKAVATRLGFKTDGLTNVKVEYLPEDTEEYLDRCGYKDKNYYK